MEILDSIQDWDSESLQSSSAEYVNFRRDSWTLLLSKYCSVARNAEGILSNYVMQLELPLDVDNVTGTFVTDSVTYTGFKVRIAVSVIMY